MITQLQIDGIPVVHGPAIGPMHAGLVFRVGFADEPLPKRGITHLVEHLALHSFGVADYHYNGATSVEYTFFHTRGSEADIVKFLNGVCAALTDLPMHRLSTEKEILRTEENSRSEGPTEALALWRHGARDYGVVTYPEWGLGGITPDDLRAWVARYFTRQNAALWIAGPAVPAGLQLNLPNGYRQPVPVASSALPVRPAYFSRPSNMVAWDAVVRRDVRAGVFAGVLERALFRSLRQESGLSYTVHAGYEPRADGSAVLSAFADALPEKQGAVLGGFVDVLAAVRLGLIDQAEVTTVVNQRVEELTHAEEQGGRLPGQAFNLLAGRPVQTLDEALAELRAVTRDDVAAVAAAAYADGLLMTPGRSGAEWAGYAAAPNSSEQVVQGITYPSIEDPALSLVAGERGISMMGDGSAATVWFDQCAAVLAWPDGARRFIGHDGIQVSVEPTLFPNGHSLIPALDARVRPELRTPMPARDAARIPVPQPRPPQEVQPAPEPSSGGSSGGTAGAVFSLVVLSPILLLFGLLGMAMLLSVVADSEDTGSEVILGLSFLFVAVACGFGVAKAIRRLRDG